MEGDMQKSQLDRWIHGEHDADFIPKSTPTSATKYYAIEKLALDYMGNYISQSRTCNTIAQADLEIRSSYAS